MKERTSIGLSHDTKDNLDVLKIHPRESYDDVLIRLIKEHKERGEIQT